MRSRVSTLMQSLGTAREAARLQPGESALEHFLAFCVVGPLIVLIMAVIPLVLCIGVPWAMLRSAGLPQLYAGLVAIPLGVALFAGMWWMLLTGRATWGDD